MADSPTVAGSVAAATHPVVGVWEVWADGAPFEHHGMMFSAEGTMLQSNPDGGNEGFSTSVGMGVWRTERGFVVGQFIETRADRTNCMHLGHSVIRYELNVTGDAFTGHAVTMNHERHGALEDTSTATLRGSRFTD